MWHYIIRLLRTVCTQLVVQKMSIIRRSGVSNIQSCFSIEVNERTDRCLLLRGVHQVGFHCTCIVLLFCTFMAVYWYPFSVFRQNVTSWKHTSCHWKTESSQRRQQYVKTNLEFIRLLISPLIGLLYLTLYCLWSSNLNRTRFASWQHYSTRLTTRYNLHLPC